MSKLKDSNKPASVEDYEFYAFISYKHSRDDGSFVNDTKWATELDKELRYLSIPTEIDKSELIHPEDDSVDPVFRDVTNLTIVKNGELEKELRQKLRKSKTLVLILSKEMVREENEKYENKEAWIYWEVRTFLRYHGNDLRRIIPVYIDQDDYSPANVPTAIELEKRLQNIEKPYQDYRSEYDWDKQIKLFYQRTAAAVAGSIFGIEDKEGKKAFWNIKEKAREAQEAENTKNRIQKAFLGLIIFIVAAVAIFLGIFFRYSKSDYYVKKAREELNSGRRREALLYAEKAHAARKRNTEAFEVAWAANDSTNAFMTVNSAVSFSRGDSLFCYIDKQKYLVVMDAKTFEEVDRIDAGEAMDAFISPRATQIAVRQRDGTYRIFDRTLREWVWTQGKMGERAVYWDIDDKILIGSYLHINNESCLISEDYSIPEKNEHGKRTYDYLGASFVYSDSLLLILRDEEAAGESPSLRVNLYDLHLKQGKESGDLSWWTPSKVFHFKRNIVGGCLMPNTNLLMAYSKDSVYTYWIRRNGTDYEMERWYASGLETQIAETRTNCGDEDVFVIDTEGKGHSYSITGRRRPLMSRASVDAIRGRDGQYSALCVIEDGGTEALYYLGNDERINLYDGNEHGYHLPYLSPGTKVSGSKHGDILCVEATDTMSIVTTHKTFLFTGGDRRMIRPKNYCFHMLSSQYAVCSGMDLYVEYNQDGRVVSRRSSLCLFDPLNDEHLMHLEQIEDQERFTHRGSYHDFYLGKDVLAATFYGNHHERLLRIYDLKKRLLDHEIQLGNRGWFIRWQDDNSYYFTDDSLLMRGWMDRPNAPDTLFTSFSGNFLSPSDRLVFTGRNHSYWWISPKDGKVRPLKHYDPDCLSPSGEYYLMRQWGHSSLEVIDARSLDTLAVYPLREPIESIFYKFSQDSRKYVFSEGNENLVCIEIPSGKELWKRAIWHPADAAVGKKYLVVQSTSLFVLDFRTGETVCEFDEGESFRNIMLSPDENWLLADDKLYSIRTKQLMATGIDEGYTALENEYIVYSNRLMKLPNVKSLFDY